MRVTTAEPQQAKHVLELVVAYVKEDQRLRHKKVDYFYLENKITQRLWDDDEKFFLAEVEGEFVGLLWAVRLLNLVNGDNHVVDRLCYVRPDYRGSSAFLKLYKSFERWAWEDAHCDEIKVTTASENVGTFLVGVGFEGISTNLVKYRK